MSDLIDREAAIDAIYHHSPGKSLEECAMILHEVPSQTPQKKGKWIECERVGYTQFHPDYSSFYSTFRCTSCLKANYRKEKYCPNCGAEMEAADA